MKILITGASGFIGSFLCEEALRRGYDTWAGVREHSSRKFLKDERLHFAVLNIADKSALSSQLSSLKPLLTPNSSLLTPHSSLLTPAEGRNGWDVIIHAGGATKCLTKEEFYKNNFECTKNFIEVLDELDMMPRQFIYLSSLSVEGNSSYGASKLMTESYIKTKNFVPYVMIRPTGVYGPREKDYFVMVQSIAQHTDFAVGNDQKLTFIYVADLVGAIFAAIDKGVTHRTYNIADGNVYASRTFSDLIQRELGVKWVLHIKAPLWFLKIVTDISDWWARHITKRPATLNKDKYHIMAQRDWSCDITPMLTELEYQPQYDLERGVKETVKWYKDNNWL